MKRSSFCHPLLLTLLLAGAGHVMAHEVETCLMRVAQASGQLQACKVAQTLPDQCDSIQQKLDRFRHQCLTEQHPAEYIDRATLYGSGQVEGDPGQSPYERQMAQSRWEQTQIRPNADRFSQVFPQFDHFKSALTEHFATEQCPNAYHGKPDRWLYVGMIQLTRYGLGAGEQKPPQQRVLHLFSPETANRCYPIPPADSGQTRSIINVPDMMLQELAKEGALVRCSDADCASERERIERQFQQYQGAYREYRQLMVCADMAQRNASRGEIKGVSRSAVKLPEYCPAKEVDVAYLNAKGLIEELDQRLFNTANGLASAAKMTPD